MNADRAAKTEYASYTERFEDDAVFHAVVVVLSGFADRQGVSRQGPTLGDCMVADAVLHAIDNTSPAVLVGEETRGPTPNPYERFIVNEPHRSIGKVGEPNYWGDCVVCGEAWPCSHERAAIAAHASTTFAALVETLRAVMTWAENLDMEREPERYVELYNADMERAKSLLSNIEKKQGDET